MTKLKKKKRLIHSRIWVNGKWESEKQIQFTWGKANCAQTKTERGERGGGGNIAQITRERPGLESWQTEIEGTQQTGGQDKILHSSEKQANRKIRKHRDSEVFAGNSTIKICLCSTLGPKSRMDSLFSLYTSPTQHSATQLSAGFLLICPHYQRSPGLSTPDKIKSPKSPLSQSQFLVSSLYFLPCRVWPSNTELLPSSFEKKKCPTQYQRIAKDAVQFILYCLCWVYI